MGYINLNMYKQTVPMNMISLPSKSDKRDELKLADNETSSLLDLVFQKERDARLVKLEAKREKDGKSLTEKDKKMAVPLKVDTQAKADQYADPLERIKMNKEAIRMHMDARIHSFLLQIINCYDTPNHYTVGKTQLQTESTPGLVLKPKNGAVLPQGTKKELKHASAHNGTLPCLWSYDRTEWTQWKSHNNYRAPNKPAANVYMEKANGYLAGNTCMGVEECINKADIDLDGNPTERNVEFAKEKRAEKDMKLREYAIGILNSTARKEIDPIQCFTLFMNKMQACVDKLAADPKLAATNKAIFKIWQKQLTALHNDANGDFLPLISRLLFVRVQHGSETLSKALQKSIFPRHFELLKRRDTYQAQLAIRIEKLKTEILAKQTSKPKKFDLAFKVGMLAQSNKQTNEISTIYKRFYVCDGKSLQTLKDECLNGGTPAYNLIQSKASQDLIKAFFADFGKYATNLTIEESVQSSSILEKVRNARGYSLRAFSKMYAKQFPQGISMSYEQLRRIEHGWVRIDQEQMLMFAKLLKVHPSVLLPELVVSTKA